MALTFDQTVKERAGCSSLLMETVEDDPVSKARLINEIVHSISVIPDAITRTIYIKECSRLMDVQEAVLYSEIRKIQNKQSEDHTRKELQDLQVQAAKPIAPIAEKKIANPFETEEREIIRILLKHFHNEAFEFEDEETHEANKFTVGSYVLNELHTDGLISINKRVRDILLIMEENLENKDFEPIKYFTQHPDSEISQYASNLLAEKYVESKRWSKGGAFIETESDLLPILVPKLVQEYKSKKVNLMLTDLAIQMGKLQGDDFEKLMELQIQYMKLKAVQKVLSGSGLGYRTTY